MIKRDDAFRAVVKFSTPIIENGKQVASIGTGFFLAKDNQHLYLITANHVAKVFNSNTIVYIAGKANNVITILLDQLKTSANKKDLTFFFIY